MKKLRLIGRKIVLCAVLSVVLLLSGAAMLVDKPVRDDDISLDVEAVSYRIFGDKQIKSSEYLYSPDDSADFVYVDFEDYGYAVFFAETMEMLEYAPQGCLPYADTDERRYYGGPTNYLAKEDGQFINIVTREAESVADVLARGSFQTMRENFSSKSRDADGTTELPRPELEPNNQEPSVNVPASMAASLAATPKGATKSTMAASMAAPLASSPKDASKSMATAMSEPFIVTSIDEGKSKIVPLNGPSINPNNDNKYLIPANPPGAAGTTYIPNAQYFLSRPIHGLNEDPIHGNGGIKNTCSAVATQLLLSYHNYYNDRRIISSQHLLGGWNPIVNTDIFNPANYAHPELNPNACQDPTLMTPETLGSTSGGAGSGSYFAYVVSKVSSGSLPYDTKEGITNILNLSGFYSPTSCVGLLIVI
ncbi:MAG: hypothetical protein FWD58_10550 [Firmicutes bacterium]|nr:hypothetical protein [Bacillota bacterium]